MDGTYWHTEAGILVSGPHKARLSPLDLEHGRHVYLYPGGSVTIPPPAAGPRQAPVWDGSAWRLEADHRGEVWWADHETEIAIDRLGDPAQAGLSRERPPSPQRPATAADVRAECSRRMQAAAGARDEAHLSILISNGIREAQALQNQRLVQGRPWTAPQTRRAAELARASDLLDQIRAASNAMEPSPPADFANDRHWPSMLPASDDEHRAVASEAVQVAARFVRERLLSDQIRWEMAIRARNGSAEALAKLQAEAAARGISIDALVDGVIQARGMVEDGTANLNAIEVEALASIDAASGEGIWAALAEAIARINGD